MVALMRTQSFQAAVRAEIASELRNHGTLVWEPAPHCPCGHVFPRLPQGGVSWELQNDHRADVVAEMLARRGVI